MRTPMLRQFQTLQSYVINPFDLDIAAAVRWNPDCCAKLPTAETCRSTTGGGILC